MAPLTRALQRNEAERSASKLLATPLRARFETVLLRASREIEASQIGLCAWGKLAEAASLCSSVTEGVRRAVQRATATVMAWRDGALVAEEEQAVAPGDTIDDLDDDDDEEEEEVEVAGEDGDDDEDAVRPRVGSAFLL